MVQDIKKAYFYAPATRDVYVDLLPERAQPGMCAKLHNSLYGTRDAALNWAQAYSDVLIGMGFTKGLSSPCTFFHKVWDIRTVVHGDDFTCLGPRAAIMAYEDQLATRFEIKRLGLIGEFDGCIREIRILNRILRLTEFGLRYEADPRHAEMLVKALGLSCASSVLTPGAKENDDLTNYDADLTDEHVALEQWATETSAMSDTVAAISVPKIDRPSVTFDVDTIAVEYVIPYSEVYGMHPKLIVATRDGWRRVPENANPYTGCSEHVGVRRIAPLLVSSKRDLIDTERRRAVNSIHWHGAAWEDSQTLDELLVGAVRTASSQTKNSGRKGAKAVKKIEMEGNSSDLVARASDHLPRLGCSRQLPVTRSS